MRAKPSRKRKRDAETLKDALATEHRCAARGRDDTTAGGGSGGARRRRLRQSR